MTTSSSSKKSQVTITSSLDDIIANSRKSLMDLQQRRGGRNADSSDGNAVTNFLSPPTSMITVSTSVCKREDEESAGSDDMISSSRKHLSHDSNCTFSPLRTGASLSLTKTNKYRVVSDGITQNTDSDNHPNEEQKNTTMKTPRSFQRQLGIDEASEKEEWSWCFLTLAGTTSLDPSKPYHEFETLKSVETDENVTSPPPLKEGSYTNKKKERTLDHPHLRTSSREEEDDSRTTTPTNTLSEVVKKNCIDDRKSLVDLLSSKTLVSTKSRFSNANGVMPFLLAGVVPPPADEADDTEDASSSSPRNHNKPKNATSA
jgi:hypothetical protein